jgi:Flp pilus assembly protein TadD
MRKCFAFIALAGLATTPAWGDVVVLKDGSRIEGDVKKNPAGYVVTLPSGQVKFLGPDEVKGLEAAPTSAPSSEGAGKAKLTSLRRSVEALDNPARIIERYQKFIEQNAGSSIESEARQDLATWQERQKQGLIKYNNRWVTPAEKAAIQEKAIRDADAIRKLLKQARLAEAETAINQAIAEDPQNATALYLRGLLQFRKEQIVQARKSFEQVNTLVPKHAPTLNNLAAILARQNQNATALNFYDQAMTASPRNKEILNNVAELLYNMPDEQRQTQIAQKVLKKFDQQDTTLARELLPQGLHRWGATWVTSDQFEQLKQAEQDAKEKLDAMSGEFDAVKVRISNIDREIDDNNKAMARIAAMNYVRLPNGTVQQSVLPPSYYDCQESNRRLGIERADQMAKLASLQEQAKAVNRNLPIPKYTGMQKLMDENSAPIVAPAAPPAPATQPTTAPTATT